MKLTIGHLYPDLLNLYGDRGNIQCFRKRLNWRGIEAEVIPVLSGDNIDFSKLDPANSRTCRISSDASVRVSFRSLSLNSSALSGSEAISTCSCWPISVSSRRSIHPTGSEPITMIFILLCFLVCYKGRAYMDSFKRGRYDFF